MTGSRLSLPPAGPEEPVRYVVIDDEPLYRMADLIGQGGPEPLRVGGYADVDSFLAVHRVPVHVVVLDLCLNRRTGDPTVLQGVRAVRVLAGECGLRVVVHTADERPEPVARAVASGARAYVSKYLGDDLDHVVDAVGRGQEGRLPELRNSTTDLARRALDVRLSRPLEETLDLLDRGMTDAEVALVRGLSPRTIEDHKRKISSLFPADEQGRHLSFSDLRRALGVGRGDIVNDEAGSRPVRGFIARALSTS